MKILKTLGLVGAGFVLGGIAVGLAYAYAFSRSTVPKQVDVAFQSAEQAEWLAELRLGETATVIKSMEGSMDAGVMAISQWSDVAPPDEKTLKSRNGFLTNVRVYHQSYPAAGEDSASITAFLANIPGRSPQSACKSGICRLDDLRLGKSHATTNSPGR